MTKKEFFGKIKYFGKTDINKYNYSEVPDKITNRDIVFITCKHHNNRFEQLVQNHVRGSEGCKICKSIHQSKVRTKSPEQFIKDAINVWGDKNDYSKVQYTEADKPVKNIFCNRHKIYFNQNANQHLRGHEGCEFCKSENRSINQTKSVKEFIDDANKVWNKLNILIGSAYKFDYSLVTKHHSQNDKIKIKCLKHNVIFEQRAHGHLQAHIGCPLCKSEFQSSQAEKELLEFLKQSTNFEIQQRVTNIISPKELDIYIPEKQIAIEFNGLYWHSSIFKSKKYHIQKTIDCESKGIQLIHIFEDEWLYNKEIVKSRLLSILGIKKEKYRKLHANSSSIIIKQVPIDEERKFLEQNHLQGYYASQVCYGLYWKSRNSNQTYLVSLMSFGELRLTNNSKVQDSVYELYRYVVAKNFNIIEGASKLFNHFVNKFKPKQIISYADRRWCINSEHTLYNRLGFKFESYSEPGFYWINGMKRYHRFKYRNDIRKQMGYNSEQEFMEKENIQKIYDVGQLKYIWKP